MDVRSNNSMNDYGLTQRLGLPVSAGRTTPPRSAAPPPAGSPSDIITVSRDLVVSATQQGARANQTQLIKESTEAIDKGFRRTQTFERADGRHFTRVEEFTVSERNARRTVIQQNASGNITRLDEVLERQDDGTFRRTQRYTDEAGDTSTQIQTGFVSADPFVLSGGAAAPIYAGYKTLRGTQLDLQA